MYNTIKEYTTNTIIIDKSKFITQLFYVSNEQEAKDILNKVRLEHPKAVHNCYAYIINGEYQNIENQSDDGEPSKTAGMPMLDILRHENLVNVLAIVTRYFGGILLGTGGLIRAYSSSVKKAVDLSNISIAQYYLGYEITISYSNYKVVEYELKKNDVYIKDTIFEEEVCIRFYTIKSDLINYLEDKLNKECKINEIEKIFM